MPYNPSDLPNRNSSILCSIFFAAGLLLLHCGCGSGGQPSGRPDIDAIPEIELRGSAAKATLYEFRAKVRKRGAAAAKQELPELIETFEAYDRLKLGEHNATFKEITEKLKAMQGTLGGTPAKDAVLKSVDEVVALVEKLPGKADPNPQVE
jgi:hypothetical protein